MANTVRDSGGSLELTFGSIRKKLTRNWRLSDIDRERIERALAELGISVSPGLVSRKDQDQVRLVAGPTPQRQGDQPEGLPPVSEPPSSGTPEDSHGIAEPDDSAIDEVIDLPDEDPDEVARQRVAEMLDRVLEENSTRIHKQGGRLRYRGLYKWLSHMLAPGEEAIVVGRAAFTESIWAARHERTEMGYIVLTDRRIIFIGTGFRGAGSRGRTTVPLESITSIDGTRMIGQGVFGGAPVRVMTPAGEVPFRVFPAKPADRLVEYVSAHIAERRPATPTSGDSVEYPVRGTGRLPRIVTTGDAGAIKEQADPIEQLERLARLRDAGAISEAEFEEKKAELLKRI